MPLGSHQRSLITSSLLIAAMLLITSCIRWAKPYPIIESGERYDRIPRRVLLFPPLCSAPDDTCQRLDLAQAHQQARATLERLGHTVIDATLVAGDEGGRMRSSQELQLLAQQLRDASHDLHTIAPLFAALPLHARQELLTASNAQAIARQSIDIERVFTPQDEEDVRRGNRRFTLTLRLGLEHVESLIWSAGCGDLWGAAVVYPHGPPLYQDNLTRGFECIASHFQTWSPE